MLLFIQPTRQDQTDQIPANRSTPPIRLSSARTGLFGLRCGLSPPSGHPGSLSAALFPHPRPRLPAPPSGHNPSPWLDAAVRDVIPRRRCLHSKQRLAGNLSGSPGREWTTTPNNGIWGVSIGINRFVGSLMPSLPRHMVAPQ